MGRKVVAVDLDGVLARYDGWKGIEHIGEPLPGAVTFTHRLNKFVDVLIFTSRCRCNPTGSDAPGYLADDDHRDSLALKQLVTNWLDKHGFVYADVWVGAGKPLCAALIDDRAVLCDPQIHKETAYDDALTRTCELCKVATEYK